MEGFFNTIGYSVRALMGNKYNAKNRDSKTTPINIGC